MLSLTSAARSVITRYSSPPHGPWSAGLRIARKDAKREKRDARPPLAVGIATQPEKGDIVLEQEGAKVFCEPLAAERLAGSELDVRKSRDGGTEFVLRNERLM